MPYTFRRIGRIIQYALAVYGLVLLAIFYSPMTDYLVHPLWVAPDLRPAPAIVVLTAYVTPDGVLNESAMRRTHEAARLFHRRLAPLVIFTGGDPSSPEDPQSADFMAGFAAELGVPRSDILLETRSPNTYFSAVNVAAFCRARGIERVLLVTDAAHMRRAVAAFRAQHLQASPAPADPWSLWWESPGVRLRKFWTAVHEYGGLLYYWWRGWI